MGSLFVKLGEKIIKLNWKLKCKSNKIVSKLLFNLAECPIDRCECKQ